MAEQYQNFAVTTATGTLDGTTNPITIVVNAGDGAIFPATASGAFRITVSDATGTNAEVMIVTTRSTDTFTAYRGTKIGTFGAVEIPTAVLTTHSAGSIVSHNLTAGAMNQILSDHLWQPIVTPVVGSFSQFNFNTGAGVTSTQVNNPNNSITLIQNDPSTTNNIAAIGKNIIGGTFTVTAAVAVTAMNQSFAGLWLNNGTSSNIIVGVQGANGLRISSFSDYATYVGDIVIPTANLFFTPVLWFRVQETAANRLYFISPDGYNFIQIFSESNTAHFTTARYGICAEVRNGTIPIPITLYSFAETTP